MAESAYVYILSSKGKWLYIGVTTPLERHMWEHKNKVHPDSFAARYNIISSSTSSSTPVPAPRSREKSS